MIGVLVGCLLGCVAVIVWPAVGVLTRLSGPASGPAFRIQGLRLKPAELMASLGRRSVFGAAGLAAAAGLVLGGPVAALVAAVYAGLAAGEWMRRVGRKRQAAERAATLDWLSALVADLRAGLPPALAASPAGAPPAPAAKGLAPAAKGAGRPDENGRIPQLTGAVWRLAEQTGAPAADLLERIEVDARAAERAAATAAAQAAGAQATALLLAALPVGGIGLGFAIGADPLQVLLRTPVGAACAVTAVLLQCGGLRWAQRLVDGPA
ncbi:hypothetical protein [Actinoplanes regularis]|uniref:Tight adherence protein B n=1 Tax=Actinoplanes regularis TaxID=52697 RepID=A0A239CEJ1_9ACTN|nr:hypothetical protein [Actinoplanes regularis]SNS18379.1 tight adherence protein B [Actinoplanes regularis]